MFKTKKETFLISRFSKKQFSKRQQNLLKFMTKGGVCRRPGEASLTILSEKAPQKQFPAKGDEVLRRDETARWDEAERGRMKAEISGAFFSACSSCFVSSENFRLRFSDALKYFALSSARHFNIRHETI